MRLARAARGIKRSRAIFASADGEALVAPAPMLQRVWFLDTETTGLPPRPRRPPLDANGWSGCRMVQMAWQLWDCTAANGAARALVEADGFVVNPAGAFAIPEESARIHGITPERAAAEGVAWASGAIVGALERLVAAADLVVAHNVEFDAGVVASELARAGRRDLAERFLALPQYCTMKRAVAPRERWPRLRDLYVRLFAREPDGRLHDAQTDVRLCREIYFEMRRREAAAAPSAEPSASAA